MLNLTEHSGKLVGGAGFGAGIFDVILGYHFELPSEVAKAWGAVVGFILALLLAAATDYYTRHTKTERVFTDGARTVTEHTEDGVDPSIQ